MAIQLHKALVTGGAGFIGSHIAEALVEQGVEVTVLDNLASGHLSNLDAIKEKISFVEGDIEDESLVAATLRGCDTVFHQAAVVSVTDTINRPVASAGVNDLGTLKLFEAARQNGVRRVVSASSSAVYGDVPQLPKTESMIPSPLSPYAIQKLTNEFYAGLYHRMYGLETVCLRYFNVYGPRQDPSSPYSGVISIFMLKALENQQPFIYGDGHQTRDFVFVKDVVQANLLAAGHEHASGNVYNIGTSNSVEINRLWDSIAGLAGCTLSPQYEEARAGDIIHSLASIQRAKEQLGFQPGFSFEEGLRRTFDWYRRSARTGE
jgi:UDP-glucose 4-epimerase